MTSDSMCDTFGFKITNNGNEVVRGPTVDSVYEQIKHPTTIYTYKAGDYNKYIGHCVDVRVISKKCDGSYAQSTVFNHELTSRMLTPNISYLLIQGLPILFNDIFGLPPIFIDDKSDVKIPTFTVYKENSGDGYIYSILAGDKISKEYKITNFGRYLNLPYLVGSIPSRIYSMFSKIKSSVEIGEYLVGMVGDIDCFCDVLLNDETIGKCKKLLTDYFKPQLCEDIIPNFTKIFLRNTDLISKSKIERKPINSIYEFIVCICTDYFKRKDFKIQDKLYLKARCNIGTITLSFGYLINIDDKTMFIHLIDMIINGISDKSYANMIVSYDGDFIQRKGYKYLSWRYLDNPVSLHDTNNHLSENKGDLQLTSIYNMGAKNGLAVPYMISLTDGIKLTNKASWKWDTLSESSKAKKKAIRKEHLEFLGRLQSNRNLEKYKSEDMLIDTTTQLDTLFVEDKPI